MNKYGCTISALLLLGLAALVALSYLRSAENKVHYVKSCEKSGGVPTYNGKFMVCLPAPLPTSSTSSLPQPIA